MYRKIVAITMLVSFVAMSTSGLMMMVVNQASFTLQMHPVHKLFGVLMIIAAINHIILNAKAIQNHIKTKTVSIIGAVLIALLVMLYGVSLNRVVPVDAANELNAMAHSVEQLIEKE